MDAPDSPQIGQTVSMTLGGQTVVGRITGVTPHKLEVALTVHQPAKDVAGTRARLALPTGEATEFALGPNSYWANLVIEVPRHTKAAAADKAPSTEVPPRKTSPAPAETGKTGAAPREPYPNAAAAHAANGTGPLHKPSPTGDAEGPGKAGGSENAAGSGRDRRHFFRFGVKCEVEILDNLPNGEETVRTRGTTMNLSGGGMLLQTLRPLMPGVFTFRLHLGNDPMTMVGKVIRSPRGPSTITPVEFVNLSETERSKLIRFIFRKMRNMPDLDVPPSGEKEGLGERARSRRERFYQPSSRPRYW